MCGLSATQFLAELRLTCCHISELIHHISQHTKAIFHGQASVNKGVLLFSVADPFVATECTTSSLPVHAVLTKSDDIHLGKIQSQVVPWSSRNWWASVTLRGHFMNYELKEGLHRNTWDTISWLGFVRVENSICYSGSLVGALKGGYFMRFIFCVRKSQNKCWQ